MRFRNRAAAALLLSGLVVAAGCGGAGAPDGQAAAGDTARAMAGHDMSAMGSMAMDTAMMRRHAAEMDSLINRMREHVSTMRRLPPGEWHARMTEHAPIVAEMVAMIDRQDREMDMGMNMSDESMGSLMGLSAEDHRAMMSDMDALRAEIGQMQTAQQSDVSARMPDHLNRIERLMATMDAAAAHMRAM